jgi:hypothetical protein
MLHWGNTRDAETIDLLKKFFRRTVAVCEITATKDREAFNEYA